MKAEELADIALRSGEILLRSGAEVYRVEDTIIRIFNNHKYYCECFVVLTGIFVSVKIEGAANLTLIKRIRNNSFDLGRIELINSFSRMLPHKQIDYPEALKALDAIESANSYTFIIRLIAAGSTAFVYTLLFRGNMYEALASVIVSMAAYISKTLVARVGFFSFLEFFISGIFVGSISLAAVHFFHEMNIYKLISGGSMILLPGMAITNSIKDALYGDIVSSMYRLAEAIFVVTAFVIGISIIISIGLR